MKIAYFGDINSHTYACAAENFKESRLIGYPSVSLAVGSVSDGENDGAVVPIENSVGGTVYETLDRLRTAGVFINAQFFRTIHQHLIAPLGADKQGIDTIYSHPQALSQCESYLKNTFPKAELIAVGSTSEALKKLNSANQAAVARTALDGQTVLESNIEDFKTNVTRFIYVTKKPQFEGGAASVIFETRHKPGALLKALNVFASHNLNMTKLQSRPSRDGVFKYWFYIEFECSLSKEALMKILAEISEAAGTITFLGMYNASMPQN